MFDSIRSIVTGREVPVTPTEDLAIARGDRERAGQTPHVRDV